MSRLIGALHDPSTKQPVKIYEGFSWPCLLFGVFWYLSKGIYKWALISSLVSLVTGGLAWIVFPFISNKHYLQLMIEKGSVSV